MSNSVSKEIVVLFSEQINFTFFGCQPRCKTESRGTEREIIKKVSEFQFVVVFLKIKCHFHGNVRFVSPVSKSKS